MQIGYSKKMADTCIRVENLGKSYKIGTNLDAPQSYVDLRDVIAEKVAHLFAPSKWNIGRFAKEDFWALKNINFEIKKGEKVAIIGKNGAGKSTLLKILSRITEPTTGRVTIEGRVSSLLEVGTGFHLELTGRENIYLNGSIMGMPKREIRRKFDAIVDFSELEKFIDTPVKRYSSGMRARLGFAVIAHLQNDVLIVDEALAVGDVAFQKKCLAHMDEISRGEGRTVLFVSHNLLTVQDICTTGFLLHNGQILGSGPINQVIMEYNDLLGLGGGGSGFSWVRQGAMNKLTVENPYISIEEISFVNEQGALFPPPYSNDDLPYLQFLIDIKKEGAGLGFVVVNETGLVMFRSTCLDLGAQHNPLAKSLDGNKRVAVRIKIPNHFLNEGCYQIFPTVFINNSKMLVNRKNRKGLPALMLNITNGFIPLQSFQNSRVGVNAPLLHWESYQREHKRYEVENAGR